MKVAFLDFDGVIWSFPAKRTFTNAINTLNHFFADENHQDWFIVISSSWRIGNTLSLLKGELLQVGFQHPDRVVDTTPVLNGKPNEDWPFGPPAARTVEIQAWLNLHPEVDGFLVLDDSPIHVDADGEWFKIEHIMDRWIEVNPTVGLQPDDLT